MQINDDWSIKKDSYNFILVQHTIGKSKIVDGVETGLNPVETTSFYPSLLTACLAMRKKNVVVDSIETIITTLTQSTEDIVKAFETMDKRLGKENG